MRLAKIADREIEPCAHLAEGVLGQADRAGLGDPLQSRRDVDAVAHQIAVALLDHVAEMNADPELDAALGRHARVALDHRVLDFDGAAHGVHHAAELHKRAVARPLDHAPLVDGDGRVDQVAAKRPKPRERPIFVGACEAAEPDHVGGQDRRKFSCFGHQALLPHPNSTKTRSVPLFPRRDTNLKPLLERLLQGRFLPSAARTPSDTFLISQPAAGPACATGAPLPTGRDARPPSP